MVHVKHGYYGVEKYQVKLNLALVVVGNFVGDFKFFTLGINKLQCSYLIKGVNLNRNNTTYVGINVFANIVVPLYKDRC